MTRFIATFFYSGLLPKAPGTWGSLATLPLIALLLHFRLDLISYLAAIVAVFILGWWVTYVETRGKEDHDPSEIVIDEVAGQMLAFLPFYFFAGDLYFLNSGNTLHTPFHGWLFVLFIFLISFGLFRIFDILKPWPVSWADRKNTAFGVMLDDIIAGALAAICLIGLIFLWMIVTASDFGASL